MIETKIKIPEGMLKAAEEATVQIQNPPLPAVHLPKTIIRPIVEAVLLWQRENIQRPTDHEFGELVNACRESIGKEAREKSTEWMRAGVLCHEWIRRMYDAPEPEVQDMRVLNQVQDLIDLVSDDITQRMILTAFRRGQKVGTK